VQLTSYHVAVSLLCAVIANSVIRFTIYQYTLKGKKTHTGSLQTTFSNCFRNAIYLF